MNKKIQPVLKETLFKCASCGAEFNILSTSKTPSVSLDVCSKCHPFYIGGSAKQAAKGRSEKLSSKFSAGVSTMNAPAKPKTKTKKENKNIVKSLSELKA